MTGNDRRPFPLAGSDQPLGMLPPGVQIDVQHACPSCPSPLAGGLALGPHPLCPWCHGTGQVSTPELDRWQHASLAQGTPTPRRD